MAGCKVLVHHVERRFLTQWLLDPHTSPVASSAKLHKQLNSVSSIAEYPTLFLAGYITG